MTRQDSCWRDSLVRVRSLRGQGVWVSVVSTTRSQPQPPMIADERRRRTDNFIELDELKEVIGRLPPTSVLPGPFNWLLEVGVPQKFPCEPLFWELHEHYLQTSRSGQLHHRQAVRVVSDQDDSVDGSISRIGSDVETEPHVDTLLLESRLEVLVGQCG